MNQSKLMPGAVRAVLFDLDGTLVDTAPDMVAVLADMQAAHGLARLPYVTGRAQVSNGAIGLLRLAFPGREIDMFGALHVEYLERYARSLCVNSALFPGLAKLLDDLDRRRCPWGVVTNKPAHLTEPLMRALRLADRAACIVSGDTLPERKPDPAPLLLAASRLGVVPAESVYIGDAARDIDAGRAAGMTTIAAAYGYIVPDDKIENWGADSIVADTSELAQVLLKAVSLDT
jgi:phosphoglycolate phosphatase